MTLPFWCSLSLMILPSEAPALPPPKKKRTFPKKTNELLIAVRLQVYFWPKDHENGRKMLEKLIKLLPRCFALCFCVYFGDLRLAKAIFSKCWLDVLRSRERELHVSESNRYFENIIFASLKSPK